MMVSSADFCSSLLQCGDLTVPEIRQSQFLCGSFFKDQAALYSEVAVARC
jgi:hypothetical protein